MCVMVVDGRCILWQACVLNSVLSNLARLLFLWKSNIVILYCFMCFDVLLLKNKFKAFFPYMKNVDNSNYQTSKNNLVTEN